MKKKVFTIVSVVVVAVLYYFSISGLKGAENKNTIVSSSAQDTFTNCIFNTGYNIMLAKPKLDLFENLDSFKALNFNSIQWYDWAGSPKYGRIETDLTPQQTSDFSSAINSVNSKGLLGFFERSYLSHYCYGQRLVYETPGYQNDILTNYGFVYKNFETGNITSDEGRSVIHAVHGQDNAGYLCKNIYENLQQSDLLNWRTNEKGTWHLKPVLKIPANTPGDTPVVRIEIIPFGSLDTIKTITLKAKNFWDNGIYNGDYIEKYFELSPDYGLDILGKDSTGSLNQGHTVEWWNWDSECHVDFRVYWYGSCDVWFDKMIVDDETANKLFDPLEQLDINNRIKQEVSSFIGTPGNFCFFVDEVLISQVPCMKYVFEQMRDTCPNVKISIATTDDIYMMSLRNDDLPYTIFYDSLQPSFIQHDAHKFQKWETSHQGFISMGIPENLESVPNIDPLINPTFFIPVNDYNTRLQNEALGYKHKNVGNNEQGSLLYEIYKVRDSKPVNSNTKFIIQPQIQGYITKNPENQYYAGGSREPTNEEIQVQAMISIAHGVNGICWYIYGSERESYASPSRTMNGDDAMLQYGTDHDSYLYTYGLLDTNGTHRHINSYGQNKWDSVSKMNAKINNWTNVLNNADWAGGYSVHQEDANHHYISNIRSLYETSSGLTSECVEDNLMGDCPNESYWEEGFYKPIDLSDQSKYFVMVNRRCVPPTQSTIGDVRILRIRFDTSQLAGSNNWVLRDVYTGQKIIFDKKNPGLAGFVNLGSDTNDIGYFKPGEGKLFQLLPVTSVGGTLAGNEIFSGNVNCNGMIYSNGHNITISPNATVTFSDSAGIEMNGGCFVSNVNADNVEPVTLTGKTETTFWKGITLIGCDSIGVYNTFVSNIKANDTAKAFSIINSYKVHFRRNTINANSNSGGIQAVYNNFSDNPIVFNVRECNFNMNQSGYSAISVFSNASVTLPIVTDWCTFNSQNDTSNAIMLTEVTGGAIKNNIFSNFGKSVVLLYSTVDIYGNTILGKDNSQGILCLSGSNVSLSPTSGQYLGGYNWIRNYGTSASNIYSNSSTFNINSGQNDFDLSDIDNSKHFTGTFSGQQQLSVNAIKNCFHKDSITNIDATHSVVWDVSTDPVNFLFTDYSCELSPPGDYFVYQYGGYNDTVYYRSGGEGGGVNPNKQISIEENVYKSLKDSININLRKRNYLTVEEKTKQILTQFTDSLENVGMVQKLYMASLSLDTTKIGITKSFLENIIVTNTQNPSLVKRAFYFIQKCKVKLGQYQSALDGFQYIMTQNPYTYEGLVASWDYAATYLLMGAGGSNAGNIEQTTEELNTPADTLLNRMTKRDINTNKSTNTNSNNTSIEQITKTFYEKIRNVTKDDKSIQEAKIKTLEKKIETTKNKSEKNDAVKELSTMKQINEVVKVKKPNTVMTHVAILNNDIKKVFGIGKGSKDESKNNLIPTTYTLYQNYPNPFNPVTKIAYDIPRDAKVKLVIYDILGREVKTLVNNEFKTAGKYITEFNGSYLSSGIYFARILVNDGKEFVAVKKLVLLK